MFLLAFYRGIRLISLWNINIFWQIFISIWLCAFIRIY